MPKLKELEQWTADANLDAAYISDFTDIEYLTGFASDPVERTLALFVFPNHKPFLFAPKLEVEVVKDTGWPYPVYGYLDHEEPYQLIAGLIKEIIPNPKRIGIEKNNLTVKRLRQLADQFPNTSFDADVTPEMEQLRLIKTPEELAKLEQAGKDADFAFKVGFNAVQAGKTEAEIAAEIEYQLKIRGVMQMSFDTLVQAGTEAANPHGATDMIKVKDNGLVLFDLGTIYQGYISDASRTVGVGTLTNKQKDIYQVCLEAQLAAQDAALPGITAEELDKIARDIITKAGYGEYFIHRLGHGIGLSEHEYPSIMEGNKMRLKEGMCFSIEPGIYIPGVAGVRIEDCIHITKDGSEPFTHTSKQLQYVGK